MTLEEFIKSPLRAVHLHHNGYYVFVRKATRPIDGELVTTFDLATVDSDHPGCGGFDSFFLDLCSTVLKHGYNVIFIESVINEAFGQHLQKLGLAAQDVGGINNYFAFLKE